ncbi:hypothetical protein OROGR_023774 [Orobanche gracilis]
MTVEVKAEAAQMADQPATVAAAAEKKCEKDDESTPKTLGKTSSYREESSFLSDLKEHEKKALIDLKMKLEDAILGNTLFTKQEKKQGISKEPSDEAEKKEECEQEMKTEESFVEVDTDISIWGIPLSPGKGNEKNDIV